MAKQSLDARKKYGIAAAFVVVAIIGSWILVSGNSSQTAALSKPRIESGDSELLADPLLHSVTESGVLSDAERQENFASEQAPVVTRGTSPFEVRPAGADAVQETMQDDRASPSQIARTTGQSARIDSEQQAAEPLVVPHSFPVSDAEKYYIPRDQRGSGRLGGPPPMDFAFGRDAEPSAAQGGFSPPQVPGQ